MKNNFLPENDTIKFGSNGCTVYRTGCDTKASHIKHSLNIHYNITGPGIDQSLSTSLTSSDEAF